MSLTLDNITRLTSVFPAIGVGGGGGGTQMLIGRVLTIDLDNPSKLGEITFEPLLGATTTAATANPFFSNLRHLPVIDEIVCIVTGPSFQLNDLPTAAQAYYFPPFGLWYNSHINKFPNLTQLNVNQNQQTPSRNTIQSGIPINTTSTTPAPNVNQTLPGDIAEKDDGRTLRPFPGDVLVEGRWGNSIRFGSSGPEGLNAWSQPNTEKSPITIISNGHGAKGSENWSLITEDVNADDSSIWMTSAQELIVKDIQDNFSIESFKTQQGLSRASVVSIPTLPTSYSTLSAAKQDRINNRRR